MSDDDASAGVPLQYAPLGRRLIAAALDVVVVALLARVTCQSLGNPRLSWRPAGRM